nr:hypothetical protein [Candidatus Levybacteria bacterium]
MEEKIRQSYPIIYKYFYTDTFFSKLLTLCVFLLLPIMGLFSQLFKSFLKILLNPEFYISPFFLIGLILFSPSLIVAIIFGYKTKKRGIYLLVTYLIYFLIFNYFNASFLWQIKYVDTQIQYDIIYTLVSLPFMYLGVFLKIINSEDSKQQQ